MRAIVFIAVTFAILPGNLLHADETEAKTETKHVALDATTIRSSAELPSVMAVVPWKKALPADLGGRPDKSLVETLLVPLDPDVFRLQLEFYKQLFVAKESQPDGKDKSKRERDNGSL